MTPKTGVASSLFTGLALVVAGFSMPSPAQCVGDCALIADDFMEKQTEEAVWPRESCERLQEAAGTYIYLSGQAVKKAHESTNPAMKEKSFSAGVALSQLSANAANVYEVFCQS